MFWPILSVVGNILPTNGNLCKPLEYAGWNIKGKAEKCTEKKDQLVLL